MTTPASNPKNGRLWLCSFPEAKAVSMDEVEAWIDSNFDFIPEGIKSIPRPDLCQHLISIQNCMRLLNQKEVWRGTARWKGYLPGIVKESILDEPAPRHSSLVQNF